jgi:hypothetical protein
MPRYRITASQQALTEIRDELSSAEIEGVTDLTAPQPAPSGLLDRRPHGQMEVWELIISLATGVGSNAAYDALKALLAKHPDVTLVEELDTPDPEASGSDAGS